MVCVALFVAGTAGFLCTYFLTEQFTEQNANQVNSTMDSTLVSMQGSIDSLYRNTIYTLTNTVFRDVYRNAREPGGGPNFINNYTKASALFSAFINANELVDNVALLCDNGRVYSTFDVGLNYNAANFTAETACEGITWLPSRKTPFRTSSGNVVTVCFPVTYENSLSVAGQDAPSMVFAVYLNTDRLTLAMERTNRTAFSKIFIANEAGAPLTLHAEDTTYEMVSGQNFTRRLCETAGRHAFDCEQNGEKYSVTTQEFEMNGLRLVNVVSYKLLLAGARNMQRMALLAVLLSFVFSLAISRWLARSLTTPLKRLFGQVQRVKQGNYALAPVTYNNDELHAMDQALCEMATTIKEQMDDIRRTEAERTDAEMLALAEQINPHFLYNTLDCVHWEILAGNAQSASDMVESLGAFLRLSLSGGRATLSLTQSLQQVKQYIDIMNYRFSTKIQFTYSVPPQFAGVALPRMVLQPLAENAIVHGFGIQEPDAAVTKPAIRVQVSQQGQLLYIEMEDNGKGIDVAKATACLAQTDISDSHMGLGNVCQRLQYHFGDGVEIRFASIPYYRNTVTLVIPLRE